MDGPNIISSGSLGNLGSTLHLVASSDFNGDGLADFLFQDSNGEVDVVGTGVAGTVGNPRPSWHVIGTGDYNGDGKSDRANPASRLGCRHFDRRHHSALIIGNSGKRSPRLRPEYRISNGLG